MDLYWFWSSYFTECLYNFLINSKHLYSYIALLLNNWSNPMVTIFCFSCSDWNNSLISPMEIIVSKKFIRYLDLEHYVDWEVLTSDLKKDNTFQIEGFLLCVTWVVIFFWQFIGSDTNIICPEKLLLEIWSVALWLCFLGIAK